MKAIKLSMLALMLAAGITSAQAQSADDIMTKRNQAMGGADAWKKVKTLKIEMTVSQGGMEMPVTITSIIEKSMIRMDINVMGTSNYQIVNGNQGWRYFPIAGSDKIDTLKKEEIEGLKDQMDFKNSQVLDYKTNGGRAEMDGKDTINGSMCYKVKLTDKEGNVSTQFIDSKTFYTMRTESLVKTDDGEKEITTVYSDYKKLAEGITFPMKIVNNGNPMEFRSVEVNKEVDEKIFTPSKG